MSVPTCNYFKQDGIRCGSPALRGKKLCYFHQRGQKRRDYAAKVLGRLDVLGPRLPRMRALLDVQEALHKILIAIAEHRIDPSRAGHHLFALQQRSATLRDRKLSRS